ncbi:MAG TPA: glycosyltransferase family 2 protein [Rhizomicrobium sp.]
MTLAICAIIRNEAPYLLEWLAFHSLCGVDLFRIYDNDSDDGTTELLGALSRDFPIEHVPWSRPGRVRQIAAYDDGLESLRGRVDFAAFIDADEFLFDRQFRPLPHVLAAYGPTVGAIAINQRVFGSAGHRDMTDQPVTHRFTRRAITDYPEHRWFKTIVRPEMALSFHSAHDVTLREGQYVLADGLPFRQGAAEHAGEADRIAPNGPLLHHYMLKSLEEFRRKQNRGAISDRPDDRYTRLTDDYFNNRDTAVNTVPDHTLGILADRLRGRMAAAAACQAPPPRPVETGFVPEVNKTIAINSVPGVRGLDSGRDAITWIKPFAQARITFDAPAFDVTPAPAATARLRLRCYRITPDYPIGKLAVTLNAAAVTATMETIDDRWFDLTTGPLSLRETGNLLVIAPPFFLPARYVHPDSTDQRYLAVAFTTIAFMTA